MCGIVGFTGTKDAKKLSAMLDSIIHRGPDDYAKQESDSFQLGMRRLAIIDLTSDIYPIRNENEDVFCIFNGEIYNFETLREELKSKKHKFVTKSDTEVIVHGYEEWGEKVFSKLRGMFAIVIHDTRENKLVIARDRLGIKPLYYSDFQGRLVFASEIKALFAGWDIDRSANDRSIYKFLMTRVHDDTKDTFFKNVKRLMPGHYMVVEGDGNYRIEQFWQPTVNTNFRGDKPDGHYAEQVKEKFIETVGLHLIADVPVGVNLSGGLDSSAVVSVANKLLRDGKDLHTGNQLSTFSAIHPGETIDESSYIDEVVKFTGANSFKVVPSVDEFWQEIEQWIYFQEEPVISTAPYAYYSVMRMAGKNVRVLLSGQGGDELFAGYIPYFRSYIKTAKEAGAYWEVLRESIRGFDLYQSFFKEAFDRAIQQNKQLDIQKMINMRNLSEINDQASIHHKHKSNLNERLMQDLTQTTVPNLLRYEDKNAMAFSIESRVPFLDHEFIELVLSIPAEQKIKYGWNRYVYRQALQGLIPEKIRQRRSKVGFVNSEWEWLQEKADHVRAIFKSDSFQQRPYWQAGIISDEFDSWVKGEKRGDGLMFWRILCVEMWLRQWVDEFKIYPREVKQLTKLKN